MIRPDELQCWNAEVYYVRAAFAAIEAADILRLKELAAANPRRRCRFCFHAGPSAPLHEMLIVHHRDAYVRPHLHVGKTESLGVLEGEASALFFGDGGGVTRTLSLTPPGRGGCWYYRMPEGIYHSLIFRSEWFVFYEVTGGPFDPARTRFPDWAPDGSDPAAVARYLAGVEPAVSG